MITKKMVKWATGVIKKKYPKFHCVHVDLDCERIRFTLDSKDSQGEYVSCLADEGDFDLDGDVKLRGLDGCCGMLEFYGLGALNGPNLLRRAALILFFDELSRMTHSHNSPVVGVIATTVPSQNNKEMLAMGFKPVDRGVNGDTGNVVTLWYLKTSPTIKTRKRR